MARRAKAQSLSDVIGTVYWIIQRPDSRTRWEDVRGQITALTAEATIATFLAGVQGTILSLSINSSTTSTGIRAAQSLSFMGILLDVISAFLALLSSTLLQSKISEVQRLLDGIDHMQLDDLIKLQEDIIHSDPTDPFHKFFTDTPLWESLKFEVLKRIMARLEVLRGQSAHSGQVGAAIETTTGCSSIPPPFPLTHSSTIPETRTRTRDLKPDQNLSSKIDSDLRRIQAHMQQIDSRVQGLMVNLRALIPDVSQIQQACQRIENIGSVGDAAGTAILGGGLAFGASAVCYSVSTQPMEVWIPTVVACACIVVLPGMNVMLKYFGIRLPSIFDTI